MKKGLLLGKFMPFHTGHIALIDFALSHTDTLEVLVCAYKNEPISGQQRFDWVNNYYLHSNKLKVQLIEYDDVLLSSSSVSSKEAAQPWAVFLKEKFPHINLFISSEPYGQYMAEYWGIDQLCFDAKRELVPVSATAIREQPLQYWSFIPEMVRPYFVKRICIVGSESTGKSVLTERLANYYQTVFVPEMARDIVAATDTCTAADLYTIAATHATAIIKTAPHANKLLFVDTDITITRSYAAFLFNTNIDTADWINEANRFDLYLFLETDCPYVQDGTRLEATDREKLNTFHKQEFHKQGILYETITGSWEQRFAAAVGIIDKFFFEEKA